MECVQTSLIHSVSLADWLKPFKVQWHQMVTFRIVQFHPGLTYIFNF